MVKTRLSVTISPSVLKFIVENSTLVDWSATFILRKGYAVQREDIEMNKTKKMLVENLVVSD